MRCRAANPRLGRALSSVMGAAAILLLLGIAEAIQITIPAGDVDSLYSRVDNIQSGDTLLLSPGAYSLANQFRPLVISGGVDNVALVGLGASPDDVVISAEWSVPHCIYIGNARHVAIENMRLQYPDIHPLFIHAEEGAFAPRLKRLHVVGDDGTACQQLIKVTTDSMLTQWCDSGLVENCVIEFDVQAPGSYTNGIDIHAGAGWVIRDNVFRNIRSPASAGQNAGAAVLAWNNAVGTVVERNRFFNCDEAISMGDPSGPRYGFCRGRTDTTWDNRHAVVRNNIIWRDDHWNYGDVGITIVKSCSAKVYNNTVVQQDGSVQSMDCRFRADQVVFGNNLTDDIIWYREGAAADSFVNIQIPGSPADWFADLAAGDLHLASGAPAIDVALWVPDVYDDIDALPRNVGQPDVGADEYGNNGIAERAMPVAGATGIEVVPNPVRTSARVYLAGGSARAVALSEASITDITGRRVAALDPGDCTWRPAPGLANGVYFISVVVDGRTIRRNAILMR